jgi:hypothetical protein
MRTTIILALSLVALIAFSTPRTPSTTDLKRCYSNSKHTVIPLRVSRNGEYVYILVVNRDGSGKFIALPRNDFDRINFEADGLTEMPEDFCETIRKEALQHLPSGMR